VARADYLLRGIYIGGPFVRYSDTDAFARDAFLKDAALADAALAVVALALARSLDALFWNRLASRVSYGI
jgi:hypothetical protein